MSDKLKIRLSFFAALLLWILFAGSNIYLMFVKNYEMKVDFSDLFPQLAFSLFVFFTFIYYRYAITKADSLNFTDLLWKVFIIGLVTALLSLGIQGFFMLFANSNIVKSPITFNLFYDVLVALVIIYTISTLVAWKRLILYQKSKALLRLWRLFEIAFGFALAFDFFGNQPNDNYFIAATLVLALLSLSLVFNLKWVAYLNFRQKWKGILFILLSGAYLYYFLRSLIWFSDPDMLVMDMLDRVFIWGLFGFLFTYAIISILVILFNLPTSSVFEQKLKEALDFQRLSQSVPRAETTDQIYETLIDSAMSAVFANAAWLEIHDNDGTRQVIRNLSEEQVDLIKARIENKFIKDILNLKLRRDATTNKLRDSIKHPKFKSIMALPILVQDEQIGYIVLLNEMSEAFNREMVSILTTFVSQASVSLENLTLIKESLENEHYKEELKIAKTVQKSLLPASLINNKHLIMEAFSIAADEVGGDYYDILEYEKNKFGLIIGDVSGKGTSAAFQMAQMKGIFHVLAREGVSPDVFMKKANLALSKCLDKNSFITATYFNIDAARSKLSFSRAGHCPGLIHCTKDNKVNYLKSDGMGLGILRNSSYDKYVDKTEILYGDGDAILLYTDGITEAKNENGELFGDARLKVSFEKHCDKNPKLIKEGIKDDLSEFIGRLERDDDYTLVIVRFKHNTDD
ncbi:MAG: SpoIIE family protein phosphatase [Ekhidna sp.]|nr:SpoIIE family protein phosphatase [Ekhidna sp.]